MKRIRNTLKKRSKKKTSSFREVVIPSSVLLELRKDRRISLNQASLELLTNRQLKRNTEVTVELPISLLVELQQEGRVQFKHSTKQRTKKYTKKKMDPVREELENYNTLMTRAHFEYRDPQNDSYYSTDSYYSQLLLNDLTVKVVSMIMFNFARFSTILLDFRKWKLGRLNGCWFKNIPKSRKPETLDGGDEISLKSLKKL